VKKQDFSFRLQNSRKSRLNVYLEPWGEAYVLLPGKNLRVEARGPVGEAPNNMLQIESNEDGIIIWGWSGSGVTVLTS
jgi:Tfp pilus assembly pilus retraction ATPase PilT